MTNDALYRDDYDQPRNRPPEPEPLGECLRCRRKRYAVVPQFPKTAVCVCAPELPPFAPPPAPVPPPPPLPFMVAAGDAAGSYIAEIYAAWLEGDSVAAFGWLFGLFNNHGSMRADPEHAAPVREHAQQMRDYWVDRNPQGGK